MRQSPNDLLLHQPHSRQGRLFIALLGIVLFVMNITSFGRSFLLQHASAVTQATVTATHKYRRKGGVYFQADYSFNSGLRQLSDTTDISAQSFYSLRPGDSIPIRYIPSMPTISESVEMSHYAATMIISGIIGLPVSLFILYLAFRPRKLSSAEMSRLSFNKEAAEDVPVVEAPNKITGIAFTIYPVQDMARARQFYEEALGLKVSRDLRGEWVEYQLWDSCFALTTLMADQLRTKDSAGGCIAFEVSNLDEFLAKIRVRGLQIKREPF